MPEIAFFLFIINPNSIQVINFIDNFNYLFIFTKVLFNSLIIVNLPYSEFRCCFNCFNKINLL